MGRHYNTREDTIDDDTHTAEELTGRGAQFSAEDLITYRLTRLAETMVRAATQTYAIPYGVTVTELRVLAIIREHQPLAASEISRRTRIHKGWISRSLAALLKRGLVARTPHPTDSRVALLSLTREGGALMRRIMPLSVARHERLLAGLSEMQRKTLYDLLDLLQNRADDLLAQPGATEEVVTTLRGDPKGGRSRRAKLIDCSSKRR